MLKVVAGESLEGGHHGSSRDRLEMGEGYLMSYLVISIRGYLSSNSQSTERINAELIRTSLVPIV